MSYTFEDQQNKLSSLLGDPNETTDDMFPTAVRKKELNRGELQFAVDAKDLREYATGSVSSQQIELPSDCIAIAYLIVGDYVITNDREVSLADYERYYNYNAMPPYYYIWEYSGTTYMKFFGSSVNGYTYYLYYYKKPTTELSATTDESLHREEFREGPVYYAAGQLLRQIGKEQEAQIYLGEYNNLVARAIAVMGTLTIHKEYARPDFGEADEPITDIQGRGWVG